MLGRDVHKSTKSKKQHPLKLFLNLTKTNWEAKEYKYLI